MYCMDDKYNQGEKDRNKIKSKPVLWPLTVVIPIYPGWGGIPSHANGLSAFYLFKTVFLVMKMDFVLFETVFLVMLICFVLFVTVFIVMKMAFVLFEMVFLVMKMAFCPVWYY